MLGQCEFERAATLLYYALTQQLSHVPLLRIYKKQIVAIKYRASLRYDRVFVTCWKHIGSLFALLLFTY